MEEAKLKVIEDYITGVSDDYEIVYKSIYNEVYFKAYSYLKSHSDAEDLTQDILIEVYKSVRTLKNSYSFTKWLNVITFHKCMDFLYSKNSRIKKDSFEYNDDFHLEQNSNDGATMDEILKYIDQQINLKSKQVYAVLILKYYDGYSYSEISDIIGISEKTVRNKVYIFKKELQNAFDEKKINLNALYGLTLSPLLVSYFTEQFAMTSLEITNYTYPTSTILTVSTEAAPIAAAGFGIKSIAIVGVGSLGLAGVVGGTTIYLNSNETIIEQVSVIDDLAGRKASIMIQTNHNDFQNMYLRGDDGIYQVHFDGTSYQAEVLHNGIYDIVVRDTNTSYVEQEVEITSIDEKAPTVLSYAWITQDTLQIAYDENNIDLQQTYALINDERFEAQSIDATTLLFSVEGKGDVEVHLVDKAGNHTIYTIVYES